MDRIYTIGYSGFEVADFLATLSKNRINVVVDVRSYPIASRYFSAYNGDSLKRNLSQKGFLYHNYGYEFGGRSVNRELYHEEGYLDYEAVAKSKPFLQGVERLCKGMRQGYSFALLCAEKNPIDCHRAILVSRAFFERGYQVIHLLPDGQTTTQEELNHQLLERYYPERNQLTLFEAPSGDESLLASAYRKRNAEIAYRRS